MLNSVWKRIRKKVRLIRKFDKNPHDFPTVYEWLIGGSEING
jgi:hypothetical protein